MADKILQSITVPELNTTYINTPESIAPTFDPTQTYNIGDYVFYNRKLYRFTSAHSAGAWSINDVTEVTVGSDLSGINLTDRIKKGTGTNAVIIGDISGNGASGDYSYSEGSKAIASENYSHAEGYNTRASGWASHAEGYGSVASGDDSHAEGGSTASGEESHAEGYGSVASGSRSHAEGEYTTASGGRSHAEGFYTISQRANQHVFGKYNIADTQGAYSDSLGKYIEIVGNGANANSRSNARTLDWDGNEYLMGDIYVGCNADSTGGSKLAIVNDIPDVPVTDVQINGTSVVNNGISNIPVANNTLGVVKVNTGTNSGIYINPQTGEITTSSASIANIKEGTNVFRPLSPGTQHGAVFYGLAKAAGDSTQSASDNAVGSYTDDAKSAIQTMLGVPSTDDIPDVPVQDVQVNGSSILGQGGVANIPVAADGVPGVISISNAIGDTGLNYSLDLAGNTFLEIFPAPTPLIKSGSNEHLPIVPSHQHESTFYGLAKAAGDVTQSASNNAVGTYTDDAKSAIQTMLGVPSTDDIPEVPVTDVQVNGTSILQNGVANIPTASFNDIGVMKIGSDYGISIYNNGMSYLYKATDSNVQGGTHQFRPIVPYNQHESTFYGLAKAAGDSTQSASSNAVGTYTETAKKAIRQMLGIPNFMGELIADVTTTEDLVELNVSTDLAGQPFELRVVKCYAIIPASLTDTNDYITARFNSKKLDGTDNFQTSLPTMKMFNKNASVNTYEIEAYGPFYFNRAYTAGAFNSTSGQMYSMSYMDKEVASVTGILIRQYNASTTLIPTGTRMIIYGVRA